MYLYEHSCFVKRKMYKQCVVSTLSSGIERCVLCNEIFSVREAGDYQGSTAGFVYFDDADTDQGK